MVAPSPDAGTLRVMSTLGLMAVIEELAARYEWRGGAKIATEFAPTATLVSRIQAGKRADVAILVSDAIDSLAAGGILVPGSRLDLATSLVGIAVRAGAAKPDISSVQAFKRTLLEAGSVVYSRDGASGIFFARLIERMGIADEINAKATVVPSGFTGEPVARGEAELAVQQISELMAVADIDVVGPLPPEIASVTIFSGGIFASSEQPDAARSLLRMLSDREASEVIRRKGLDPIPNG